MLVTALLCAAGLLAGLYHQRILIVTVLSFAVTVAYGALMISKAQGGLVDLLILFGYLSALQTGYFIGLYVARSE